MIQNRLFILLLFALIYVNVKGSTISVYQDEKEMAVMVDSVKPCKTILHLLDSVVNDNAYANNLYFKDKEEYRHCSFLVAPYPTDKESCPKIGIQNVNELYSDTSLCGYFKYNGHTYFLEKGIPKSLFKKTRKKVSIKARNPVKVKNPNPEEYLFDHFIDEEPGVFVLMTYSPKSGKVVNVEDHSMSDILYAADQRPCYIGGMENLIKDKNKLKADCNGKYSGFAIVEFVIEKDGTVSNITILDNKSTCDDAGLKKMFGTLGNWIPGKNRGQACRIRFTMRFVF